MGVRAYNNEPLDDKGRAPGRWDIPVQPPRPYRFEDRTETYKLPHTEVVGTCPDCNGAGAVTCSNCNGAARNTCTRCRGLGIQGWHTTSAFGRRRSPRSLSLV